MTWLIIALVLIVLVAMWVTWTAMRIDRLAARSEAAWLRLDAALVRRSAALRAVVDENPELSGTAAANGVRALVRAGTDQGGDPAEAVATDQRAGIENAISACISDLPPEVFRHLIQDDPQSGGGAGGLTELGVACSRVQVARTFYNDAVRASRALRSQRIPRLFRLGRANPQPEYFDIDDGAGVATGVHP